MDTPRDINTQIAERFKELPGVVQKAITSSDVQKRLRDLADSQKLHVDQWQVLENIVMLTLLGFQPIEDLEKNLKDEIAVSADLARDLATHINEIVFEPIRAQLEEELEHPGAAPEGQGAAPTPPAPPPAASVPKAPASGAYKPGESSVERRDIVDDPYREPPQ